MNVQREGRSLYTKVAARLRSRKEKREEGKKCVCVCVCVCVWRGLTLGEGVVSSIGNEEEGHNQSNDQKPFDTPEPTHKSHMT